MEKRIRVLIAMHPRLMRDVLATTFADQPDIEVVGEVEAVDDEVIGAEVDRTAPDFLVISLGSKNARPPFCEALLRRRPSLGIIAVDAENNHSVVYRVSLSIQSHAVEASEEGILEAIRGNERWADAAQAN